MYPVRIHWAASRAFSKSRDKVRLVERRPGHSLEAHSPAEHTHTRLVSRGTLQRGIRTVSKLRNVWSKVR